MIDPITPVTDLGPQAFHRFAVSRIAALFLFLVGVSPLGAATTLERRVPGNPGRYQSLDTE